MQKQQQAYIYAISAILLWSTAATAFKIALRYMDFIQLLFYATATSTIISFFILIVQGKHRLIFKQNRNNILTSIGIALLNPFGYYLILLKAYSLLPAQIAQPLNYTWPMMLVLLSVPILKQKLKLVSILALLICFAGVIIISTQGKLDDIKIESPFGVFLALISSVFWALFWLINVRDKRDEGIKLFYGFAFGLLLLLPVVILFSSLIVSSYKGVLSAIYVGFFELGITFFLWLKALQLTSSTDKISHLVYISPFMSLIFIHFVLGENIYYTTITGLLLIIAGIGLQQITKK